jgi:hypothetical protein
MAIPDPATTEWVPIWNPGSGGGGTFAQRTISGTQDGTNVTFTVAVAITSFQLFRNGVLQVTPGDYTFTTGSGVTTITFAVWPPASDDLLALWG